MDDMQVSQDKSRFRRYIRLLPNRFQRWQWDKTTPVISWFFWKYLKQEQGLSRFWMGWREFCWVVMCGHDMFYGLHVANIWWRIGKNGK